MDKTKIAFSVIALAGLGFILNIGCRAGWELSVCVDLGASIYPAYGGGELLLSEALSLSMCLIGVSICLIAYANDDARFRRLSTLFLIFFIILFIGENNLMRDDLRAPFLIVLVVWTMMELALRRSFTPILLLGAGCVISFLGQLGDHTTLIQFQNLFDEDIAESMLAPLARVFGWLEEPLELAGSALLVIATVAALDIRPPARRTALSLGLGLAAIAAITIGNSFLHVPDDELHDSLRKIGLFCSVFGVGCASACAVVGYARAEPISRAYCAILTVAAYWITVYAPTVASHQHSKTISSWIWIFPVLAGYYYLTRSKAASVHDR